MTATEQSVQVWDSDDGQLLVDVKVGLRPSRGLLWFNNHLFIKTRDSEIRQIDASTGSTVSEWFVPDTDSCIALPQHGKFIAYSTEHHITFWCTSKRAQLGPISRSSEGRSIAFSPDDHLFAAVHERKIIIKTFLFSRYVVSSFNCLSAHEKNYLSDPYSHARDPKFGSTALRSMHGNTINSSTRKRY